VEVEAVEEEAGLLDDDDGWAITVDDYWMTWIVAGLMLLEDGDSD